MASQDCKVVSFVNLKGGVGKTALSVNFAAQCASEGHKTLLIDLDPQTNATFSCMSFEDWQDHAKKHGTVADLFGLRKHTSAEGKAKSAKEVCKTNALSGVDLIPSHLDLFTIDLDLGQEMAREKILKRALKGFIDGYDIVICDCPPNLTLPTQNAIAISTHYIVPVSPDFLSGLGVGLLLNRIEKMADTLEAEIVHAGIVMSRVGRRSHFRSQTTQALRQTFSKKVLTAEITERSAVAESAAKNQSIFASSDAEAKREFAAFGTELLKRIGVK
ncbi:MAG: ParA family protein [Planctomycetes bacterium]|jgi:chromosome partitioning protein|nr:ParA family protein [Planctomycetota bacterium]